MNHDSVNTRLQSLFQATSKHSDYQRLHPNVQALVGSEVAPAGRHEAERQHWMARHRQLEGLCVLDIGANTGYFSFAALAGGARRVVSQEGNPTHAQFIEVAARGLGLDRRLEVRPSYFDFHSEGEVFDLTLCLNVLHHLGDDFGDRALSIDAARASMLAALNRLARRTRHLWMQLGFNWKGDRRRPLFAHGTKAELIDFVRCGTAGHWHIEDIAVVDPTTRDYVPLDDANIARCDALGEFLNRPLFAMRSLTL